MQSIVKAQISSILISRHSILINLDLIVITESRLKKDKATHLNIHLLKHPVVGHFST